MQHVWNMLMACSRSWLQFCLVVALCWICWICYLLFSFLLPANKFYQQKSEAIREPHIFRVLNLFSFVIPFKVVIPMEFKWQTERLSCVPLLCIVQFVWRPSIVDGFKSNTIIFLAGAVYVIAHFCLLLQWTERYSNTFSRIILSKHFSFRFFSVLRYTEASIAF